MTPVEDIPLTQIVEEIARLRDLFARRLLEDKSHVAMQQALLAELEAWKGTAQNKLIEPLIKEFLLALDRLMAASGELVMVASFQDEITGILEKWGFTKIEFNGEFDPNLHEIVTTSKVSENPSDSAREVRTGYMNGTRVLRPTLITYMEN